MKKNSSLYCGNCGQPGHIYKKCLEPITSMGIILIQFNPDTKKNEYLMVRRRNTIGFVEFMRGKYTLDNYKYILNIFTIMTIAEREQILTGTFDELWESLWMKKNMRQYQNEYSHSKKKFDILKNGLIVTQLNQKLNLEDFHRLAPKDYTEQEWGFPKGRRNLRESDMEAAIRECNEETGLKTDEYKIIEDAPTFQEVFLGTNNIRYKHVYFLANYESDKILEMDLDNSIQTLEISEVSWFPLEICLTKIRNYNTAKKELIKNVDEYLSRSIIIRE